MIKRLLRYLKKRREPKTYFPGEHVELKVSGNAYKRKMQGRK